MFLLRLYKLAFRVVHSFARRITRPKPPSTASMLDELEGLVMGKRMLEYTRGNYTVHGSNGFVSDWKYRLTKSDGSLILNLTCIYGYETTGFKEERTRAIWTPYLDRRCDFVLNVDGEDTVIKTNLPLSAVAVFCPEF